MSSAIENLLARMGPAIGPTLDGKEAGLSVLSEQGEVGAELAGLLLSRNGFYGPNRALLVRPLHHPEGPRGIIEWNARDAWRTEYDADLGTACFFADNVFGEMYALRDGGIGRFDPETAEWEVVARSLDAWAQWLLTDEEGCQELDPPIAAQWTHAFGEIPLGERLRPPAPFVCAESAAAQTSDFKPVPELANLLFLAPLANALPGLPDGAPIRFRVTEEGAPPQRPSKRKWWPFGR